MITQLQQLGLNEKEAKVYLASLELGQSVVQEIAKKAGINRPTAYFVIDGLMKGGLMSSFHKGKKQYFVAADPDHLAEILEKEKLTIEERKKSLEKLLPQLRSLNNRQIDKPVVKYFEGKDGINAMNEEFFKYAKGIVNMVYSVDAVRNLFTEKERENVRSKRINAGVKTRVIYTYKDGVLESSPDGERRKVPFDKFPISCDIAVYDSKVRITSLEKRVGGIVIEDEEIAKSFKAILDLAWEAAEKYQ